MTPLQLRQRAALRGCTFPAGSADKRFLRTILAWPDAREMTDKGAARLNRMAHTYRAQLGGCFARPCPKCDRPEADAADRVEMGAQMGLFAQKE